MMNMPILIIVFVAMIMGFHSTEAATYVVGDTWGWQNPPNSTFYSSWASSNTFNVGDTLTFNFATGVHDVATVTQDAYDNCNTANPLNITNNGPANIILTTSGTYYYICTFSNHCSVNQKLAVNVGGSTSSPPGTTAGSPPPPPPPPSNSSASGVTYTAALVFMPMAVMFGMM